MKKLTLIVFLAVLFSCGGASKDFSKVKTGMNEQQVVQAVGEPDKKMPIMGGIVHWHYNDKDHHIVVFEADTVSNVTDEKGASEAMDAFQKGMDSLGKAADTSTQK